MKWHNLTVKNVEEKLQTDAVSGLSDKEAAKRLRQNGENVISERKSKAFIVRFAEQFNDFMVIILLIAAAVSFIISIMRGDADFVDPIIILVIVCLNAILGVVQESRAEKSLEALKKISAPRASVIRGGRIINIPAEEVVEGDLLTFKTGDLIPADARLVTAENLQTDESSLTGESAPVFKSADKVLPENTPLGDRINIVLSSASVTMGHGTAIAVHTGMNTEVGRIADMIMETENTQTPLQQKLAGVGKVLGISALVICAVVFVTGVMRAIPPFEMFMTSVSLAVAAIPEGLPAIVTIMLAIGVQRMAGKNAIIRNLPSVETLGGASVICSDKTGTLTQNKMEVTKTESADTLLMLKLAALCCDSRITDVGSIVGTPTENAIIRAAMAADVNKRDIDAKYPRISEIPFDSRRKLMTTVNKYSGASKMITKGAVDILLPKCRYYYDGSKNAALTESKKREILAQNEKMAKNALRVIAVAYKDLKSGEKAEENDLVFVGMMGMIDPPRKEVKEAVKICKKAGIRPVMITGDHVTTATAIAEEIGIMLPGTGAMTGAELESMPQKKLEEVIDKYSVFARVTPEHKVRIVKAWQTRGETVAMTGDGVNDAPALKRADIGCAMGMSGTEVAKSAADMILTDDNFATIVEAVKQGRGIYANIKKAIQFLLSSNIGEILTIFIGILFGWSTPLAAIQLLWVNLVTDSLPAIALGLDPVDKYAMTQPPQNTKKSIFAGGTGAAIAIEGCMIGALAILAFSIGKNMFDVGGENIIGRSMAFSVLSLSQLVHAFNMRSEHSVFSVGIFKNHYLVGALIVGALLQSSVISVPVLAKIFKVSALNFEQWLMVAILSLMPLVLVELQKRFNGK